MVAISVLGRRGFHAGAITAPAAGNAVVRSDVRGARAGRPGGGVAITGTPTVGRAVRTTTSQLNHGVRGTVMEHGRLIARDRHVIERIGRTTTSAARQEPASGRPNPEADGPPRPAYEMVNRTYSWQSGTDATRNLDNDEFHAKTTAGAKPFPLGNQGSTPYVRHYGGTPGLVRPYGVRGVVLGPAPRVIAQPGGEFPAGTVIDPGTPQDGPQLVYGGLPHGLHTTTVPPVKVTQGRRRDTKQMTPVRQGRPENSKIAGQSYSQTVVHQSGQGGGPLPRMNGGRAAGLGDRFVARRS